MNERWPEPVDPIAAVRLQLDRPQAEGEEPVTHDISAAASVGETLFLSADECAYVEVLHRLTRDHYGDHDRIDLASIFDLPADDDEMDVEGLAADDGWLWIVGSHSRTRRKPKQGSRLDAKGEAELAELKDNPNRFFIGRVPLSRLDAAGERFGVAGHGAPKRKGCKPGMLAMKGRGNALAKQLRRDPHLAPFLSLPAKENGLDIEGIAVKDGHVAVGLRGPVINGWACVLEFQLTAGKSGALKLDGGYAKRWFELDGLGVRDLKRDGEDLLLLAGPTMSLDGPSPIYRWRNWRAETERVVQPERLLLLPYGYRCDHAEAITLCDVDGRRGILVVNDSPARSRLDRNSIVADIFETESIAPARSGEEEADSGGASRKS
jgi:hypothetical protein